MTKRTTRIALGCFGSIFLVSMFLVPRPEEIEAHAAPCAPPYSREPGWTSVDTNAQSLGMVLADINGDGFKDLVIANGNDLARHPVTVFYNNKHGGFPKTPSFSSSDVDYHAGIAVGDVNQDGFVDVAVTVGPWYDARDEHGKPVTGYAKIYMNRQGQLEPLPSWRTEDNFSSFGAAFGDYDGDGDLDLAVAVAFEPSVKPKPGSVRIYKNERGRLSSFPEWRSAKVIYGLTPKFADINEDGFLDLFVAARGLPIFRTEPDKGVMKLSNEPFWTARQELGFPLFLDVGKIGSTMTLVAFYNDHYGDKIPPDDLAKNTGQMLTHDYIVNRNVQPPPRSACAKGIGSDSRLMAYAPLSGSDPIWTSDTTGWGAGVRLVDVNNDGMLDLLASRWGPNFYGYGAPLEIFLGTPRAFQSTPSWSSSTCGVGEAIAVGDLDRSSLVEIVEDFQIEWERAIVMLSQHVAEEIREIKRDGVSLGLDDFTSVPGGNWISFKRRLQSGEQLTVRYAYSTAPDIALASTYDSTHIFYHGSSR